ncbi:hypothetical protein ACO0QE_004493 [Hanseniaspora vineae]
MDLDHNLSVLTKFTKFRKKPQQPLTDLTELYNRVSHESIYYKRLSEKGEVGKAIQGWKIISTHILYDLQQLEKKYPNKHNYNEDENSLIAGIRKLYMASVENLEKYNTDSRQRSNYLKPAQPSAVKTSGFTKTIKSGAASPANSRLLNNRMLRTLRPNTSRASSSPPSSNPSSRSGSFALGVPTASTLPDSTEGSNSTQLRSAHTAAPPVPPMQRRLRSEKSHSLTSAGSEYETATEIEKPRKSTSDINDRPPHSPLLNASKLLSNDSPRTTFVDNHRSDSRGVSNRSKSIELIDLTEDSDGVSDSQQQRGFASFDEADPENPFLVAEPGSPIDFNIDDYLYSGESEQEESDQEDETFNKIHDKYENRIVDPSEQEFEQLLAKSQFAPPDLSRSSVFVQESKVPHTEKHKSASTTKNLSSSNNNATKLLPIKNTKLHTELGGRSNSNEHASSRTKPKSLNTLPRLKLPSSTRSTPSLPTQSTTLKKTSSPAAKTLSSTMTKNPVTSASRKHRTKLPTRPSANSSTSSTMSVNTQKAIAASARVSLESVRHVKPPVKKSHTHGHNQKPVLKTRKSSNALDQFSSQAPATTKTTTSRSNSTTLKKKSKSEVDLSKTSAAVSSNKKPLSRNNSPRMPAITVFPGDTSDADNSTVDVTKEPNLKTQLEEEILDSIPGIDKLAGRQIFQEIVVQGDEVHWEDIVGLDTCKNSLKEAVVYPFLRPDLFKGLREPIRGMLLFGPPGTGKTMLARAVATESKSTFFSISASSLTSKYMGESEKLVRALFQIAKKLSPSIIFVDEIDSILGSRNGDGEHESSRRIKNEFLIQWSGLSSSTAGSSDADNKNQSSGPNQGVSQTQNNTPNEEVDDRVLVLAATNLPWSIDEAARRRFVRRQYIPLPESDTRVLQIKKLMKFTKNDMFAPVADEDSEVQTVALLAEWTQGYSGSDITSLCKDAAMGPLRELGDKLLFTPKNDIRPVSLVDFENSLKYIKPSVSVDGLKEYDDWARQFGSSGV